MLALLGASVTIITTIPTKLGFDIAGGLELVYQVIPNDPTRKPTSDEMQKTVKTIRDRVNSLGVTEAEVQTAGADTIYVALPSVKNPARARKLVGSTARLLFYKWEDNIIVGPGRSKSNIANDAAADTPFTELFEAVTLAAKQKPSSGKEDLANDGRKRPDFYVVDTKKKIVLTPTPSASKEELLADPKFKGKLPKNAKVVIVPRGTVIIRNDPRVKTKFSKSNFFVIRDNVELTGDDIERATADTDSQTGQPAVGLKFTGNGGKIFERVTKELRRDGESEPVLPGQGESGAHRFAIVLDGESISLASISTTDPSLANGISGGQAQITNLSLTESRDVAKQIELGALPVDLKLIAAREVSASLGKQDLRKGLTAAVAGFLLVLAFLLIFYRVLGIIAGIALVFYGILFFALTKLVGFTFTLPGIAGLVLTLSVAADANIVIFERIKEEIRAGRSIKKSISTGYSKGFATIVDANVVTLITAFILFVLATAGVRGFAAALGLGTIVSLFTAVLVTSAILGILAGWRGLNRPSALGAGKESAGWRFDFMGASKYFFSLSGVILLIGSLAVAGSGLNLGIDFESGTRINVGFEKPSSETKLRAEMLKLGVDNAKIQRIVNDKEYGTSAFQISSPALEQADVDQLKKTLDKNYDIKGNGEDLKFSATTVGPTFGAAIARSAIIAIIFSLLVIGTYIALRFAAKFSVPVIIALLHDILITVGVYALVGREVSSATVAALLTIVGFSLYDTIIVFDRIRENLPRMPRAAFSQIVNRSMSEVLTRSLATSLVTALPITALLLFGGATLQDFAFALLIGTISGTYSSIFIASPVLTHWKEREPIFQQRRERIAEDNNGVVPAYYVETVGGVAVDHRDLQPGATEIDDDDQGSVDAADGGNEAAKQGGGTISRASSKAARKASREQRRHGRSR